jgi:hypothetical protein
MISLEFTDDRYKYYAIAKKLLKPLDDPDLYTVQTLILMVIYLMCSYKMSLCYTHLGAALRAAQRLGLHRKLDYKFTPIELEERKRTFWAAYNIERYPLIKFTNVDISTASSVFQQVYETTI